MNILKEKSTKTVPEASTDTVITTGRTTASFRQFRNGSGHVRVWRDGEPIATVEWGSEREKIDRDFKGEK